jgi:hypothetical protein
MHLLANYRLNGAEHCARMRVRSTAVVAEARLERRTLDDTCVGERMSTCSLSDTRVDLPDTLCDEEMHRAPSRDE